MSGEDRNFNLGPDRALRRPIDTTVVHPARRYDYWLGGRDNYAVDRASGDAIAEIFPTARIAALENRRFMRRAVTYLVREAGIRQFLDIGSGLPTSPNVHEVAQGLDPTVKVAYVDNDPIVLAHARALLTSSPQGATTYIDADMRDPEAILTDPQLTQTLDLTKPVGLLMFAVLHFIADDDEAAQLVNRLAGALVAGSHLAFSVGTADFITDITPELIAKAAEIFKDDADPITPRSADQVTRILHGFELVPPGLQVISHWRADDEPSPRPTPAEVSNYGAIARI